MGVGGHTQLQQFILLKMHTLYDVSAIVENTTYVLGIDSAGKVWVTVVSTASTGAYSLRKET